MCLGGLHGKLSNFAYDCLQADFLPTQPHSVSQMEATVLGVSSKNPETSFFGKDAQKLEDSSLSALRACSVVDTMGGP